MSKLEDEARLRAVMDKCWRPRRRSLWTGARVVVPIYASLALMAGCAMHVVGFV